jgi:phytoene desaturase
LKKVIIIGAGIAGLTAGIYALKNGYDAEIYEMHSIAGGECTGWDRGKYHFDGCIHWLMGSKKGSALNKLWRETGALDDSVNIINSEYFGQFELDGRTLTFYRDVDLLEKHLLELSPIDKKEIREMCKVIRGLEKMEIPLEKPFDMMKMRDGIRMGLNMLPFVRYMKYMKIDIAEFAGRFQDPLIKTALSEVMPANFSALSLLSTLGSMSSGDSGWPEGGSRSFAQRIQAKFNALGGKIFFKSPVEKIITENGSAKGIALSDGRLVYGDFIISATDGYEALFKAA